jgi:ATP phosphoribosyltransferase
VRLEHGRRMRVATKYHRLTRRFFLDHHVHEFRIVDSSGATEGAPYAGQAELIVDITSTGSTLKANDLRVLDDGLMLSSQAVLAASLGWKQTAKDVRLQELFMALHHAQEAARACVLVQVQAIRLPQKLREELVNRSLVVAADQGRFVLPRDELATLVAEGLFAEEHAVSISSLDYASY